MEEFTLFVLPLPHSDLSEMLTLVRLQVYSPWFKTWGEKVNANLSLLDELPLPAANLSEAYESLVGDERLRSLLEIPKEVKGFGLDEEDRKQMEKLYPVGHQAALEVSHQNQLDPTSSAKSADVLACVFDRGSDPGAIRDDKGAFLSDWRFFPSRAGRRTRIVQLLLSLPTRRLRGRPQPGRPGHVVETVALPRFGRPESAAGPQQGEEAQGWKGFAFGAKGRGRDVGRRGRLAGLLQPCSCLT